MKRHALALFALLGGCGLFPSLDGLTGPDASEPEEGASEASTLDASKDVATADVAEDAPADAPIDSPLDAPKDVVTCDATSCNGSCVDLSTSAKNCGACGHDCLGATCTGGQCASTVMITNESSPYDLAADSGKVFWTDQGSGDVATCNVTNCPNTRVTLATTATPDDIAIDATYAYWTQTGGNIYECARAGCNKTPTVLATAQTGIDGITTANGVVYWSTTSAVMSCAAAGCSQTPTSFLAHGTDDLAVVGQTFVAAAFGSVYLCTLPSCTGLVTIPSSGAESATSDGKNVFYSSTNGNVFECPVTGCTTATKFATSASPNDIVTDGTTVYWVDTSSGQGLACAAKGCTTPTVLASGMSGPRGIAVDSQRVYFADTGGKRILWVAK